MQQDVIEEIGGEGGAQADIDPSALEAEIKEMVAGYVGMDVDVSMPLAAQGLDSLAAMELRQKLQVLSAAAPPLGYSTVPANCRPIPSIPSWFY